MKQWQLMDKNRDNFPE